MNGLKYRPEIDGLRAVAVLAVVLFHARLDCPGGFVGVDVFFVISGFLITSLILRDLESSKFSLINFWERRVRRIAPALTVWVAITLVAGWFLSLPGDYQRLGQATVAQGLVLSNLYHGWKIDYFSPGTDAFPLLHTWSLAVEEQFYIALPLLLLAIRKWRPGWLRPLLVSACVMSFVLAVWMTKVMPRVSFWILPTRAWELLLGSLLAAHPLLGITAPRWAKESANGIGLIAIIGSITLFDESMPSPGVATLVPTLGAVAFLWANTGKPTTGGRLLAWSPLVFVGKISYSLYLIHWPVMAYAHYWYREELPWAVRLGLMLGASMGAVLSLYLVEAPVRRGVILAGRRPLFLSAFAATVLLMVAGHLVFQGQGVRARFSVQTQKYLPPERETVYMATHLEVPAVEAGKLFEFGHPRGSVNLLVWGDSHAMALMPALDELCSEHGLRGSAAMHSNTPPLLGYADPQQIGLRQNCSRFNAAVMKLALERDVQWVVLAASWAKYSTDPQFGPCLADTVSQLVGAGRRVVLVRDVPIHSTYVPRQLVRAQATGRDVQRVGFPVEEHRMVNQNAAPWLDRLAGPSVIVLDPTPYLTDQSGLCRAELNGFAMYRDEEHLSAEGARRLKPMFVQAIPDERSIPTRTALGTESLVR